MKLYIILILAVCFSIRICAQQDITEKTGDLYGDKQYEEVIRIAKDYLKNDQPDQFTTAFLKYDIANSYYKTGDFVSCWKYMQESYQDALKIELQDSAEVKVFIDIAQRLGDYSFLAEEYRLGINSLVKGIDVAKEKRNNDIWRIAKLYHKTGAVYRMVTQFENAITYLEEGQKYLPKLPDDRRNYLSTVFLAEMAQVYNDKNQLNKSIEIFKTILAKAYEEENVKRISIYNNNIAIAYERKGDYGKAVYHLEKSLEAKFDLYGEKTPKIIANYTNLGRVNTLLGRYSIANEYFKKLDELIGEVFEKDHVKNSDTHYNIATGYYQQKKYEKALTHAEEAVRIRKLHKPENDLMLGDAQLLLGATLSKMGKYEEAVPILKQVLELRKAILEGQDTGRKSTLTTLYETLLKLGRNQEAIEYLNQAFDAMNYSFEEPYSFDQIENPIGLIDPLALNLNYISQDIADNPSDALIAKGELLNTISDSLIQHIKLKFDDVASRRTATAKIQDLNEALLKFNYTLYTHSQEEKYAEKAINVIEQSNNNFLFEAIAEDDSSTKLGLSQEVINTKTKLQDSITIIQNELESIPLDERTKSEAYATKLNNLNRVKKKLYAIVKTIEFENPKYFESIYSIPSVRLKKIQSQMGHDEEVISYFMGNSKVFGMRLTRTQHEFHELGDAEKIELKIQEFLSALKNRSSTSPYRRCSKSLHNLLIAPFKSTKTSKRSIIANDLVSLVPFEMLIDEQTNLPMCLSHVISYQYSISINKRTSKRRNGKGALAMAPIFEDKSQPLFAQNINLVDRFRSEVSYLPETEAEVEAIHNLWSGEMHIHENASETTFKEMAQNKALLHLATHGFVDNENPDFSRLYFNTENDSLNDGKLHAHEIVNLNLSADLVTLSACNTGTGQILKGEGISSLGRAFAYANCPNQLISLWPANDKSTTQLMTYYYSNLKAGLGKSTALTEAKRKYLANAPEVFQHPYYWAGFVYYGQDSPLQINSELTSLIWGGLALLLFIVVFFLFKRRADSIEL